jgi:type II secretory pathway pseudopilin PulG
MNFATQRPGLRSPRRKPNDQSGYLMLTLMLVIALMTIAMVAALPDIKQQINRDRETEMIHRGNAYMRAIQHYYKKLGRYPTKIEDLENTNEVRYLRKRYTDPMNVDPKTGKERDFKLLHQQDISLNNGPLLGSGLNGPPPQGGVGGQGAFGGMQSGPGGFGGSSGGLGGSSGGFGGLNQPSNNPQNSSNSSNNSTSSDGSSNSSAGSSGNSSDDSQSDQGSNSSSSSSSSSKGMFGSTFGQSGQTFGGGPIIGVASQSKGKTIRVFYEKNHYNDWYFIYVMGMERGGLLRGPVNPNMPSGNVGGLTPSQMNQGASSNGQSGFGQGFGGAGNSSFGGSNFGSSTFGSNGSSPNNGSTPSPPQNQSPQQ